MTRYKQEKVQQFFFTLTLLLAASGLLASCTHDDEPAAPDNYIPPYNITVILAMGGPGDNSYNDRIVYGMATYAVQHDRDIYLLFPEDMDEVRAYYSGWIEAYRDADVPSMLVLAGSEYEDLIQPTDSIGPKCRVLLFESGKTDLPERTSSFRINRYGTSYLTGAMVSRRKAHVIAANDKEIMVRELVSGFCDGYEAHSGHPVDSVIYLADDYRGFSMQSKGRRLTDSIGKKLDGRMIITEDFKIDFTPCYNTFFTAAGSSNQGVYNGVYHTGMQQAIGMDKDCSDLNDNIPFSIDIAIDKLLIFYLEEWESGRELPQSASYGMESGYISLVFSTAWNSKGNFIQWDSVNPEYSRLPDNFWQTKCDLYKEEALIKEKEYD